MSCFHCKIPEFAWEIIFEALKHNPLTLVNCSRVSSMWAQMLASKKQDFMISLVLPLLTKHLAFDDLKNCRLVCQNWKQAVDGLNDSAPKLYSYFKKRERRPAINGLHKTYTRTVLPLPFEGWTQWEIESCTNLQSICQRMDDIKNSTNPFPSKIVHLKTCRWLVQELEHQPPPEYLDSGVNCMKEFLGMVERFGNHIWHLVITISTFAQSDFIRTIVRMLHSTPEIKSLTLHMRSGKEHLTNDDFNELLVLLRLGHLSPRNLVAGSRIDCEVEESPPILPCLTSLSMPHLVVSSISKYLIMTYKEQLESLECGGLVMPPVDKENPLQFPKLRTLKMRRCGSYRYQLDSVIAPRLEQLILWLEVNPSDLNIFCNLIDSIGHLSPSLVELRTYGGFELYLGGGETYSNTLEELFSHQIVPGKSYAERMEPEKVAPVVSCQFLRLKTFRIHFLFLKSPHLRWLLSHFPFLQELHLERSKGEEIKFLPHWAIWNFHPHLSSEFEELADLWLLLPNLQNIFFPQSKPEGRVIKLQRPL